MTGDGPAAPGAGSPTRRWKVVAGHPSAEELAALTVALAAVLATGGPAVASPAGGPGWAAGPG